MDHYFEKMVTDGEVVVNLDGEVDVNPATLQHKKTKLQVHTLIELLTNPKNIVFEKSLKDFRDSRRPKKLRMLINIQCWRYLDRETLTPTIEYTLSQTKIIKI